MDLAAALELAADLRPRSRLLADLPLTYTTVPDKTAGDVFTEAMWDTYLRDNLNTGVLVPIANTTLISAASSIDFTSIPSSFGQLLCVITGRGDTLANSVVTNARLNNDTANNYYTQSIDYRATTSVSAESLGASSIPVGELTGASGAASAAGGYHVWIPNYAGSTLQKGLLSLGGFRFNVGTQTVSAHVSAGFWASTAAVNRLTFFPTAGNFVAGTRATLYGMGSV